MTFFHSYHSIPFLPLLTLSQPRLLRNTSSSILDSTGKSTIFWRTPPALFQVVWGSLPFSEELHQLQFRQYGEVCHFLEKPTSCSLDSMETSIILQGPEGDRKTPWPECCPLESLKGRRINGPRSSNMDLKAKGLIDQIMRIFQDLHSRTLRNPTLCASDLIKYQSPASSPLHSNPLLLQVWPHSVP